MKNVFYLLVAIIVPCIFLLLCPIATVIIILTYVVGGILTAGSHPDR